jgi:hypothetical protein
LGFAEPLPLFNLLPYPFQISTPLPVVVRPPKNNFSYFAQILSENKLAGDPHLIRTENVINPSKNLFKAISGGSKPHPALLPNSSFPLPLLSPQQAMPTKGNFQNLAPLRQKKEKENGGRMNPAFIIFVFLCAIVCRQNIFIPKMKL